MVGRLQEVRLYQQVQSKGALTMKVGEKRIKICHTSLQHESTIVLCIMWFQKKKHGWSLEILRERGSSKLKENIIMKLNRHFQRGLGWGDLHGGSSEPKHISYTPRNPSDWKFVTIIFLLLKYIKGGFFLGYFL